MLMECVSEAHIVVTTVETFVRVAVLTALELLLIPRLELAMKSVNASSGPDVNSVVPDPDQRKFSGYIESLQMTASSRISSKTEPNNIYETLSYISVEKVELSVSHRNFDPQTHTHGSKIIGFHRKNFFE